MNRTSKAHMPAHASVIFSIAMHSEHFKGWKGSWQ